MPLKEKGQSDLSAGRQRRKGDEKVRERKRGGGRDGLGSKE